ncbi:L,D-transpeptidase family protein [Sphingomicrobium lutaoense]|uniref:Lipoprotein-anchoring transpeptidase ErfK/SrfK n=1 Tax=Sphingomicrobium lutaoense TaxID=515949 RepID=A0A839Z0D6_9SPHN|nr:L,D-transpeptidase [Sphingomicrobium lutaoense]MBB3764150.1 lipoprotein-anchoring transpeptidase ErfK/SrfK [Sphingomicrobium lutaoense]
MKTLIPAFAAASLVLAAPSTATQQSDANASPQWGVSLPSGPFAGKRDQQMLAAQIMLAAAQHSPGVIDGYPGGNSERAIRSFQKAKGLDVTGKLDDKTLSALRSNTGSPLLEKYEISAEDASGDFRSPASSMKKMAETGRVGYASLSEKLAEKFGMSEGLLKALNPGVKYGEGKSIVVVAQQPGSIGDVARIEIEGSANELRAFDEDGKILASFPATVGSSEFPSPSGSMTVNAVAPEANYTFDPSDQQWGGDETLVIPAGPNNPVGGIWIDLAKDGYGIHGSSDPAKIGKTASHGCVRLTNWDAQRLAKAVSQGTKVEFL